MPLSAYKQSEFKYTAMTDKHNNLMLQENGYPYRICGPDYSEEPVLTLNEAGMPVLETQQGCTMPADYSFACINNYVHAEGPQYEELQYLALGMATHIEKLERKLADASKDAARLHWILPIITGNEDDMTNAKTVKLAGALMMGLDSIDAVDAAMIKDQV